MRQQSGSLQRGQHHNRALASCRARKREPLLHRHYVLQLDASRAPARSGLAARVYQQRLPHEFHVRLLAMFLWLASGATSTRSTCLRLLAGAATSGEVSGCDIAACARPNPIEPSGRCTGLYRCDSHCVLISRARTATATLAQPLALRHPCRSARHSSAASL